MSTPIEILPDRASAIAVAGTAGGALA